MTCKNVWKLDCSFWRWGVVWEIREEMTVEHDGAKDQIEFPQ